MEFYLKRAMYVTLAACLFGSATSAVTAIASTQSAATNVAMAAGPRDHDGDGHDRSGDKGDQRDKGDKGDRSGVRSHLDRNDPGDKSKDGNRDKRDKGDGGDQQDKGDPGQA